MNSASATLRNMALKLHKEPEDPQTSENSESPQASQPESRDLLIARSINKLSATLRNCASRFHKESDTQKGSPSNNTPGLIPKSIVKLFRWIVSIVKRLGNGFKNACVHRDSEPSQIDGPAATSPSTSEEPVTVQSQQTDTKMTEDAPPKLSSASSIETNSAVGQSNSPPATEVSNESPDIDEHAQTTAHCSSDKASPAVETYQSPVVELPVDIEQPAASSSSQSPIEVAQEIETEMSYEDNLTVNIEPLAPSPKLSPTDASPAVETPQSPLVEVPLEIEQPPASPSSQSSVEVAQEVETETYPEIDLTVEVEQPAPSLELSPVEASPEVETPQSPEVELPTEVEQVSRRRVLAPRSVREKVPSEALESLLYSGKRCISTDSTFTSPDTSMINSDDTTLESVSSASSTSPTVPNTKATVIGNVFSAIETEMWAIKQEIKDCKGKEEYGKVNNRDSAQFNLFDKLESAESRRIRITQGIMAYKKRLELEAKLIELDERMANLLREQLRASERALEDGIRVTEVEDTEEAEDIEEVKKETVVVEEELKEPVGRAEKRAEARKKKNAAKKAKKRAARDRKEKKEAVFSN